ncbi:MAG: hypothetical protein U5L96_01320 [Owenweeksia sp.]|nr:hypothetical protein [Owenweeksia sp.]
MELFPKDILSSLDFSLVRERLADFCTSTEARENALSLSPTSEAEHIEQELKTTDEILALLMAGGSFPSTRFDSILEPAHNLKTAGSVLEEKAFSEIRSTLMAYSSLHGFLEKNQERFPMLFSNVEEVQPQPELVKRINEVIDGRAQVHSHASKDLARIREQLSQSRSRAARVFDRVLKKYRSKDLLADFDESISENRRVLAIQASYKGQVQGIFHGSSSKGSIVFIEPGETVEINNEVVQLMDEERQEIHRILKELSHELRPNYDHLLAIHHKMVFLDLVKAKALFAKAEDCCLPELKPGNGEVYLKEGYNPVLKMLNREKSKDTFPMDLNLNQEQRILVISGPNAGGKTIALKTLGLLSAMLQSGLLIPVHPSSRFPIFNRLFADIGDSQSIQNELSTYSSKLQKMRHFLHYADENTLLLIDEFGSGSDPELGSALAQVFLEKLNRFGVFGIFTTHYNAIKALAAKLEGVNNAAMLFDKNTLTPEYLLEVGNPGSSYTFEVAGQSGIAAHIINEARSKTSQATLDVDRLLVQLQEDKLQLQKKGERLNGELSKLRQLEQNKQANIEKLEAKLKTQTHQNEENDRLLYWGQRFQKLVEGWLNQQNQKDKKQVVGRFIGMLNQRSTELEEEESKTYSKAQSKRDKKIQQLRQAEVKLGDRITILDTGMTGTINKIKGSKYVVAMGNNLSATLEREKFIPADAALEDKPKKKKRKKKFSNKPEKKGIEDDKGAPKS